MEPSCKPQTLSILTDQLDGNVGLAKKAAFCFENSIDFNDLKAQLEDCSPDEAEDVCFDAVYYATDNVPEYLYGYWYGLLDYAKNYVYDGMGDNYQATCYVSRLLLAYYNSEFGNPVNENKKTRDMKKKVTINEGVLRNMVRECIRRSLMEQDAWWDHHSEEYDDNLGSIPDQADQYNGLKKDSKVVGEQDDFKCNTKRYEKRPMGEPAGPVEPMNAPKGWEEPRNRRNEICESTLEAYDMSDNEVAQYMIDRMQKYDPNCDWMIDMFQKKFENDGFWTFQIYLMLPSAHSKLNNYVLYDKAKSAYEKYIKPWKYEYKKTLETRQGGMQ